MPRPQSAVLVIAAPLGTIGAFLLVIGCLATERDRGQALAGGIRYVQAGCVSYLSDPRIPRHPEATELCPIIAGPPSTPEATDAMVSEDAPSSSPPVLDASAGEPDGATSISTQQGNAGRKVDGG